MKIKHLIEKHHLYNSDQWEKEDALYTSRISDYIEDNIPKHPAETATQYRYRTKTCEEWYEAHVANIINWTTNLVFEIPLSFTDLLKDGGAPPEEYTAFQKNCDGKGTDLIQLFRRRFTDAHVHGASYWFITPSLLLREISQFDIYNWSKDKNDKIKWVNIHSCEFVQDSPDVEGAVYHTFEIYHLDRLEIYYVSDKDLNEKREQLIEPIQVIENPYNTANGCIPLICLNLGPLALMPKLSGLQIEHWQLTALCNNAYRSALNPVGIFIGATPAGTKNKIGVGEIGPSDIYLGKDADFKYVATPIAGIESLEKKIEKIRQEIYRLGNAQLLAVDYESSTGAMTRSGESRNIDRETQHVALVQYVAYVLEAIRETMTIYSQIKGDKLEWEVAGTFSQGFTADEVAKMLQLGINSDTFLREIQKLFANQTLYYLDQKIKQQISREIDSSPIPQVASEEKSSSSSSSEEKEDKPESGSK